MTTTADLNDSLPTVVQLLLDKGLLSAEQSEELRNAQPGEGGTVETLLVEKGLVTERDVAEVYSEYLGAPIFELPDDVAAIDRTLARQLPEKLCRDQFIAPIGVDADAIDVAFVNPNGLLIVDEIEFLTGLAVRPAIASRTTLEALIESYYSASGSHKAKKKAVKHDLTAGKQAAKLGARWHPMKPTRRRKTIQTTKKS